MLRCSAWALLSMAWLAPGFCRAAEPVKREPQRIAVAGQVVDEHSKGVAGIRVRGTARDAIDVTTDEQGRFTLDVLAMYLRYMVLVADDPGGARVGVYQPDPQRPLKMGQPVIITLAECQLLPIEVADADGQPAEGVSVGALFQNGALAPVTTDAEGKALLRVPRPPLIHTVYAVQPDVGFDYRMVPSERPAAAEWLARSPVRLQFPKSQTIRLRLIDAAGEPVPDIAIGLSVLFKPGERSGFASSLPGLSHATTGPDGVALFRGVPDWNDGVIYFQPAKSAYIYRQILFDRQKHADGTMTVRMDRSVPLRGRVQLPDGGPAVGLSISIDGSGYELNHASSRVTTDRDGRFEIALDPSLLYAFVINNRRWAAPLVDGVVGVPGKPLDELKLQVRPATRVHGRVTAGAAAQPVSGSKMFLHQLGRPLHELEGVALPNIEGNSRRVQPQILRTFTTDEEGRFEFFVGPGQFKLTGPGQIRHFEIADEQVVELDFSSPRQEKGPITGTVMTGEPPQPVADVAIAGIYRSQAPHGDLRLKSDAHGRFSGERYLHATVLYATSPDGKLAAIEEIGPDTVEATLRLNPVASLKARLIDSGTGDPLARTVVRWGRPVHRGDDRAPALALFGGSATTDDEGWFEAPGLVVGQTYQLTTRVNNQFSLLLKYTPAEPGQADLGDLRWEAK